MRILLLNYEFPPMGGGAGRATFQIALHLSKLGHEVDILTSKLKTDKAVEFRHGFTIYRVNSWRKSIHDCGYIGAFSYVFFAFFRFTQLLRTRRYDVLHYFFSMPTGLLTLVAGKNYKIPYILSLRGSDVPLYDPYNRLLQKAHRLLKPLTIRIWRRAADVVALSSSLRTTALKTDPKQKIAVIPNGIDIQLFRPLRSSITPGRPLQLITVARLVERKGIQHILAALAQIAEHDVFLTIVGTGNFEAQLKRLCRAYSLQSVVRFYGYCPRHQLVRLYSEADVFILTSMAESFGMVFLEAMACGLPIIGARTGGIPSIISDGNGLLVDPTAIDDIRKAIVQMRDDPEFRRHMGYRNRKKVEEEFTWASVANSYLDFYQMYIPED